MKILKLNVALLTLFLGLILITYLYIHFLERLTEYLKGFTTHLNLLLLHGKFGNNLQK